MGEVGDAASLAADLGRRELTDCRQELKQYPDSEHDQGRYLDEREEEEEDEDHRQDSSTRVEQHVAAEDSRDRTARSDGRYLSVRTHRDLRKERREPAEQIEEDEADPSHRILDVV